MCSHGQVDALDVRMEQFSLPHKWESFLPKRDWTPRNVPMFHYPAPKTGDGPIMTRLASQCEPFYDGDEKTRIILSRAPAFPFVSHSHCDSLELLQCVCRNRTICLCIVSNVDRESCRRILIATVPCYKVKLSTGDLGFFDLSQNHLDGCSQHFGLERRAGYRGRRFDTAPPSSASIGISTPDVPGAEHEKVSLSN